MRRERQWGKKNQKLKEVKIQNKKILLHKALQTRNIA